MKKWVRKTGIILFWLCLWQIAAVTTDNHILLVGPVQVVSALLENIVRADFLKIVFCSLGRIGLGFFLALFCGLILGAASYRFPVAEEILAPVVETLKAIPVASFVVLLLIWFGASKLSFFISFLIVFPNVYVNTIAGLKSTDKKLLEMAEVLGMSGYNRIFYIYRPALLPYLKSCLKISLGMSWKSGVAAEVIGLPDFSLGEQLYMSKIYLDTAGLFAWTLLVIVLSFLFEKLVLYFLECFANWKPFPKAAKATGGRQDIVAHQVHKGYGEQMVITDFTRTMKQGGRYLLMAPSGAGKTTLLRLLTGLETPDGGQITGNTLPVGMVFQEDRVCEDYDTITNVMLTTAKHKEEKKDRYLERISKEAAQILPRESLKKPVRELSGGMRRRVSVLRAMNSTAGWVVLDEPFAGLDEASREQTARYINKRLAGRILLVTSHREEDAQLLQAERISLTENP